MFSQLKWVRFHYHFLRKLYLLKRIIIILLKHFSGMTCVLYYWLFLGLKTKFLKFNAKTIIIANTEQILLRSKIFCSREKQVAIRTISRLNKWNVFRLNFTKNEFIIAYQTFIMHLMNEQIVCAYEQYFCESNES